MPPVRFAHPVSRSAVSSVFRGSAAPGPGVLPDVRPEVLRNSGGHARENAPVGTRVRGEHWRLAQVRAEGALAPDVRSTLRTMRIAAALLCLLMFISTADAQTVASNAAGQAAGAQTAAPVQAATVACASTPGQRTECPADTSRGVVLLRSRGEAPCLLGRTWGYDQTSVWVSDGCSAEFATGAVADAKPDQAARPQRTFRTPASCSSTTRRARSISGCSATAGI